ncbi:DUF1552 domain-containing protein [Sandaracinus amylolyticus]|nr:DUF1552 domain-containing protein [Sandaracinus amylolyticus]
MKKTKSLSKTAMKRRTFLRGVLATGAAVSVGVPILDTMLDENGVAFAGGEPLPVRFGVWFWGNGVRPERWTPSGAVDWTPSEELAPLATAGVKPWVSVVTGCEIKTATHPHHSGMAGIMTGAHFHQNGNTRDTIVSTFAYPSVDQIAAAHFEGMAPFRSLEFGITRFRGTDEGTSFQHLSHNGPNNPNPSEYSPSRMYARLFGAPVDAQIDLARQSVLDAVGQQIRALQPRVSRADRVRLEQHFDSVRALEMRLAAGASTCTPPENPGDFPDVGGREPIADQNRAMSDLCALALACDLTRSFSMFFSTAGSGVIMWPVGASNGLHQINHDEGPPHDTVHAATVFTMEQLGYFLARLRDTPDAAGSNVLDNCSILATSELSEGWTHSNREFPILVCGRGGGALRGNVHHRVDRESTSIAVLTALRGAGIPAESFGVDESYTYNGSSVFSPGRATTAYGELLAG